MARIAYAGDGEWMVAQGAERASAPCAERGRGRGESDEWIHGGVVGVMIDCFLVLWWTSGVAGSVCGRVLGVCIVEGCVWGMRLPGGLEGAGGGAP